MTKHSIAVIAAITLFIAPFARAQTRAVAPEKAQKEWAFLIFLNGHNNLSEFGDLNINQLETIGSSDKVDVIVQWAKLGTTTTKRLRVIKDADDKTVTSPIIEELPRVDMGDYKELVKFVKWSAEKFPAKHYFVSFWNHGSGWNRRRAMTSRGISYDDYSGNHITTLQMGIALREIAQAIGHKVDIVGADACLMAMGEVATEIQDSTKVYVASEDLIPGVGWPYHKLIERWVADPMASPATVGKILVEEYHAYLGTGRGVTLSALDLEKLPPLNEHLRRLGNSFTALSSHDLIAIHNKTASAVGWAHSESKDLGHWLMKVRETERMDPGLLESVQSALKDLVILSKTSSDLSDATGMSFWAPESQSSVLNNMEKYQALQFAQVTHWDDVVKIFANLPQCAFEEGGQWASSVLGFSSQYGEEGYSAKQALGACNTPRYGDYASAWTPKEKDSDLETLSVGFPVGVYATGAVIRESFAPGFVTKIEAIDGTGQSHVVWEGVDPSATGTIADFKIEWPVTPYLVHGLTISINPKHTLGDWEEIDSVQLLWNGVP